VPLAEAAAACAAGAWQASWPEGAVSIVAALQCDDASSSVLPPPLARWGTSRLRTDGRLAALVHWRSGRRDAVVVDGSLLSDDGAELLNVRQPRDVMRTTIYSEAPSFVRALAAAELDVR
jgi:hypothetical protein